METKEKTLLFKDTEAAASQLFEAQAILKTVERVQEWYKANELEFSFEELKKIAEKKESELSGYFYSKLNESIGESKLARKAVEKQISVEVNKIMKFVSSSIGSIFRKHGIEKKDIDLTTCEFTENFRNKLQEQNTYYIETEDEQEVYRLMQEIAKMQKTLRKFIYEKYGFDLPITIPLPAWNNLRFFDEKPDRTEIEPNPAVIMALRWKIKQQKIKEGHQKQLKNYE